MIFQAHKGVCSEAPENTMPAFKAAVAQGYGYIETDLGITADGVFVTLHDNSINRTARHISGALPEDGVAISDICYEDTKKYDFGCWFSQKFKGTALPRFVDVLELARENGVKLKIDNKLWRFDAAMQAALFALIKPFEETACLTCNTVQAALEAARLFPKMQIHYDGTVDASVLEALSVIEKSRLAVWMPYKNKSTDWAKMPFANAETAALVKQYASLGIWLLNSYAELEEAEAWGADIVETNGNIKPCLRNGVTADMHTHSSGSHDSVCEIEDMLCAQSENGTALFAVTDHCDIYSYKDYDIYTPLVKDKQVANRLNKAQSGVTVLTGMEISEGFWLPKQMEKAYSLQEYDVVVGSVHCVRYNGYTQAYSQIDFSAMPKAEIYAYLHAYFDDMAALMDSTDMDILAHLTCPLRYITGKYGVEIDMSVYADKIDALLEAAIKKGIALEVNTSSFDVLGDFFPATDIIKRYFAMGGYLVSLGSDAHIAPRAAQHFDEALKALSAIGFKHIYYCKRRVFYQCSIDKAHFGCYND